MQTEARGIVLTKTNDRTISANDEKNLAGNDFDTSSISELNLISKNEYRSILTKYLPAKYFEPDTKHVLHYLVFFSL